MANNANTIYLKDKDKNIVLPATDWSVINNKPTNLATTDQLPALTTGGEVTLTDAVQVWNSGPKTWDSYKYLTIGGVKLVEIILNFNVKKAVSDQTLMGSIPTEVAPPSYLYSVASPQSFIEMDEHGNIWVSPSKKDNNSNNLLEMYQLNSVHIFYLK